MTTLRQSFSSLNPLSLTVALLGWTAIALIAATTAYIALQANSVGFWLNTLKHMLGYYYAWGVIALLVYFLLHQPISRSRWSLVLFPSLLVAISLVLPFVAHFEDWQDWMYGSRAVGFHTLNFFIFMFVLAGGLGLQRYQRALRRERQAQAELLRTSELENQLIASRLETLQMQINPHFLFNALNSIGALVETRRNDQAYNATELLGQLLRNMLDRVDKHWISIEQELQFLQQYIDMEKIRFGEQLQYRTHVAEECLGRAIPVAVLQPVVENAIKHGVRPSPTPVTVRLTMTINDEKLNIIVSDTGSGTIADKQESRGLGLSNIRNHLQLLYDDQFSLEMRPAEPQPGTEVFIRIPIGTPEQHPDSVFQPPASNKDHSQRTPVV